MMIKKDFEADYRDLLRITILEINFVDNRLTTAMLVVQVELKYKNNTKMYNIFSNSQTVKHYAHSVYPDDVDHVLNRNFLGQSYV
jgi:hypothetical protein